MKCHGIFAKNGNENEVNRKEIALKRNEKEEGKFFF